MFARYHDWCSRSGRRGVVRRSRSSDAGEGRTRESQEVMFVGMNWGKALTVAYPKTRFPDMATKRSYTVKSWHLIQYSEKLCTYEAIKEWQDAAYRMGCMGITEEEDLEISFREVHSHTGGEEWEYTVTGEIANVIRDEKPPSK